MLRVANFFVHETMNERYATVNRKGHGQFFVSPREARRARFVTQFGYTQHIIAVFDWETQNVPVEEKEKSIEFDVIIVWGKKN